MGIIFLTGQRHNGCISLYTALTLCLLIGFLQISCSPEAQKPTAHAQGILRDYTLEPFVLELQTDKKEITIAEQLELILEVSAPENTEVEFPSYETSLGDFILKETRTAPVRMAGSGDSVRVMHRITYFLEPYLSGTYTIPAMTVIFRSRGNDKETGEITTESVDISVTSFLEPGTDQAAIKDIKFPLSMPPDRTRQFMIAGLVLLLAAFGLSGLFYWKHKTGRKFSPVPLPAPDEIALQDLDRLLSENLLAGGGIKLFHLRISDILRRYIETRFGLKAPDRTTEEFLMEISLMQSSESSLLGNHKALLSDFLTQCDLVKFAKHEPTPGESEKTALICREFIEKTRELKI